MTDLDETPMSPEELRRYVRHVAKLLGMAATAPPDERAQLLRRARHWLVAVLHGVDLLLMEAQRDDTIELPRADE